MDLSIIICTWNNSSRLRDTLDAISRCDIPDGLSWEIIIVNNNCTDNTDQTVELFRTKLPFNYIKEPIQGLSRARNRGLKISKGDLLLFTDDDVLPDKYWVTSYYNAYKVSGAGFYFGGPVESKFELPNLDKNLLKKAPPSVKGLNLGNNLRQLSQNEYFISANWACPRIYLNNVGLFDVSKGLSGGKVSVGEETELMDRLNLMGLRALYLPQAKIVHYVPKSKCTLSHISSRLEAVGFNIGTKERRLSENNARIPFWIFRKLILSWIKFAFHYLMNKNDCSYFLDYKKAKGVFNGFMRGA